MPGPANEKGRKKRQNKKQKAMKSARNTLAEPPVTILNNTAQSPTESALCVSSARDERRAGRTPPVYRPNTIIHERGHREHSRLLAEDEGCVTEGGQGEEIYEAEERWVEGDDEVGLLESSASYIYDPGNGPRVRDFFAFLRSPFAAEPGVSFADIGSDETTAPLGDSGEGRREEEEGKRYSAAKVIPVLNRFLPGEFATILWFNRTRRTQRICPACQRLYHLGDDLQPLIPRAEGLEAPDADPDTIRMEQFLSGICSIPCFALATYNYGPGAVWAYGVRIHLLDEDTREVLESEGSGVDDQGLSVYVRMTRYDGRGLIALLAGGA